MITTAGILTLDEPFCRLPSLTDDFRDKGMSRVVSPAREVRLFCSGPLRGSARGLRQGRTSGAARLQLCFSQTELRKLRPDCPVAEQLGELSEITIPLLPSSRNDGRVYFSALR
jgi:hypothetical protein